MSEETKKQIDELKNRILKLESENKVLKEQVIEIIKNSPGENFLNVTWNK